jgi:multidrug resistance efflux pump
VESRDVEASAAQARAQVEVAQANLALQQAELRDAESTCAVRRLLEPKAISKQQYDADLARYNKARASISNSQASIARPRPMPAPRKWRSSRP